MVAVALRGACYGRLLSVAIGLGSGLIDPVAAVSSRYGLPAASSRFRAHLVRCFSRPATFYPGHQAFSTAGAVVSG